jgi:hypothetical protein
MQAYQISKIRGVIAGAVCLHGIPMAFAKMDAGGAAVQTSQPLPLVPASTAWMGAVLLGLMWLAIAAIVLGPLVRFFTPKPPAEPKNLPTTY